MNKTYKIKGTQKNPAIKILPLAQSKIRQEGGLTYIEGYANTKNKADRYGDVPCVLASKRDYVYELTEFKKNPVLLLDHVNRVDHIAGSVTKIFEDESGLYFKAVFSASQSPAVAHARQVYAEGHAKGISIAGRFHYEDAQNPERLTLAEIYEISLVAVPADPDGLVKPSQENEEDTQTDEEQKAANTPQRLQAYIEIENWISSLK